MVKICFIGAGSTVFAKNVLGDCILKKELGDKLEQLKVGLEINI